MNFERDCTCTEVLGTINSLTHTINLHMHLFFLFTDFYFKLFFHCNPKRSYFLYFVLLKSTLCKTETCKNGKNTGTIAFRFRQVLLQYSHRESGYPDRLGPSAKHFLTVYVKTPRWRSG